MAQAATGPCEFLVIGFHESDPLLPLRPALPGELLLDQDLRRVLG